jgi:Flp pilus assembly protein TadD
MRRIGVLQLHVAAITLALLLPCITSSWAAAPAKEICDVDADFALGLEDYPTAIALHRKVLRAHNDNALAHYHLGFAYGMTGDSRDEISEYLAAAKLGLNKWDLFLNLGLAYLGQNDGPKASKELQTAVLLGPDHPEAHFNLAIAYERSNRLREALQEITVSLRLAPLDPDEGNTKAIICVELGDLVCAHDEWVHLVRVAPDYVPARVNLAILSSSHLPLAASLGGEGLTFAR